MILCHCKKRIEVMICTIIIMIAIIVIQQRKDSVVDKTTTVIPENEVTITEPAINCPINEEPVILETIKDVKVCPQCSTQILSTDNSCSLCGYKL